MSVDVMAWAWKQDLDPSTKLVLMKLADIANDDGICWPSWALIEENCRISRASVYRTLKKLEELGMIVKEARTRPNGSQTSNVYAIQIQGVNLTPPRLDNETHPVSDVTPPEPSLEPPESKPLAAAPQKKKQERARDAIWDALEVVFGPVTNDNARGKRNKAVKLLKQSEAQPFEIQGRARRYQTLYPDAAFTDMALANQWDSLGHVIPVIDEQAGVRAMEEREAEERRAEEADAVSPEEAAVRAKALLDHLKGNT